MKTFTSIIFTLFIIIGCEKKTDLDCSNVQPPSNYFEININDSSGNSLITQDSIRLYNNSFEKYIRPQRSSISDHLQIFYPDIESGVEYFIELDSIDSDTLKFNYSIDSQECYNIYIMNAIEFNGQNMPISEWETKFDLLKQ